jgi:hypothetical protein
MTQKKEDRSLSDPLFYELYFKGRNFLLLLCFLGNRQYTLINS